MAYGKLKADTLIYDNSGSDVEVTISSLGDKAPLASPTFTGTVTILLQLLTITQLRLLQQLMYKQK